MILRKILGVAIGIVLANLLIYAWETALTSGGLVSTADLGAFNEEYVLRYGGVAAQLWILAGWGLGTALGAFAAFAIARSDWTGWLVAGWVGALTAFGSLTMFPHPLWLSLAALALPFVGALLAFGLYRRWRAARLHLRH